MSFTPSLQPAPIPSEKVWFIVHPKGLIARQEPGGVFLPEEEDVTGLNIDRSKTYSLGVFGGRHAVAASISGEVPAPFAPLGLRALAQVLDPETFGVAGRALHVMDWATTSSFCGRCGAATAGLAHERCMKCPQCGFTQYPRIAPAIIVLVRRGEEALLARNARFPGAFFSTLAGFSEIGESLEETLVREVFEEVGVRVGSPRYFGSQPWPFPHSLMVGFTAQWESGHITVDGKEIAEARWFRADALPPIPPSLSIARKLINAWTTEITGAPAPG